MKVTNCLFLGERLGLMNDVRQAFRTSKGEEIFFKGLKGLVFGDVYPMTDDKMKTRPVATDCTNMKPTEEEVKAYHAHKESLRVWRLSQRRALEVKKPHPDIVKALALLRPFCRGLDLFELKRFVGFLEFELSKSKRKRR